MEAIGFAEDADVIFIHADICVYMLHLKSMQFDEVPEKGSYSSIFPYSSFYTPRYCHVLYHEGMIKCSCI
jgi:hypothetical protein